jgi:hypothetical protein
MTQEVTQDLSLDTHIDEPSLVAGDVELLRFALQRSRAQFAWKVGGLDAAGLAARHPPTVMTLGGLVKHVALVEEMTTARLTGRLPGAPWDGVDWEADPHWEWRTAAQDSPQELYRLWRCAVARARSALDEVLAGGGPDRPASLWPRAGRTTARRLLVDLHDEYARHVGHADLLREAVDGLVGEDPPQ